MRIQERRRSSSIAMSTYHRIAICLDPVEAPPHGAAAAVWRCGARQRRRKLGSGSARAAPAWRIRPRTASFLTVHMYMCYPRQPQGTSPKPKRDRGAPQRDMRAGRGRLAGRRQDSTLKDTSLIGNPPRTKRQDHPAVRCGEIDLTCGND